MLFGMLPEFQGGPSWYRVTCSYSHLSVRRTYQRRSMTSNRLEPISSSVRWAILVVRIIEDRVPLLFKLDKMVQARHEITMGLLYFAASSLVVIFDLMFSKCKGHAWYCDHW